jgi:hypothetical protein
METLPMALEWLVAGAKEELSANDIASLTLETNSLFDNS